MGPRSPVKTTANPHTGRHTLFWKSEDRAAGDEPFIESVARQLRDDDIRDAILFGLTEECAALFARRPGFVRARADREYSRAWPSGSGPADRSGIRAVTPADAEVVARIIADATGTSVGALVTPEQVRADCFNEGWFNAILVADGEDVGYGNALRPGGEGSIGWIAVIRSAQGRGYGRRLFHVLLEELDRTPIGKIWLDVEERNAPAIRLYESFGFRESGGPYVQVEYRSPGV